MADGTIVFIGCYTPASGGGRGEGIVAARRRPDDGRLEPIGLVAATPSPSFLVRHPTLPVLFATNEVEAGAISAWAIGDGGSLVALGRAATGGAEPCHAAVAPGDGHLVVANYGTGSLALHPLEPATGAPGERTDLLAHEGHGVDPERQAGPHPHMVSPDPSGASLLAVDLGTDSVYRYDLDAAAGRLVPYGGPVWQRPSAGPRHLARHPDGRRCFLVGELDATVTVCEIDGAGVLHERGSLPASAAAGHVQPSEIAVRGDGRFLYVANRGPDTVAVFALDGEQPRYVDEVPTGGRWPRHFAIIGEHLYVANERSHSVGVFRLDADTGLPVAVGAPFDTPSPTCVMPE
ncbi:6-phosphogluconolactonase, cycloisomerase 2 family [Micromonospora pattaloongensis]|uniref:6-phosphogluconolactonase, cycloisomerase 2 family n=1 Tax=Micromonospora pattaloongensis TaxID=405436 RepID=A0A1H3FLT9_9ACTN|nr:lactonase family protein [Micromonospora pattaloongensis]SDX91956.1 6-phosphogluconolactonase, cycloisomerase 2 family [Micromonospora pattaloongensis]